MPGEEWRTLDAPSQQPLTEVVVKAPDPIQVDGVLVNPDTLDDYMPSDRGVLRK